MKIKINTYTDESGQDTRGKLFIVATVIVLSDSAISIEENLRKIEKDSGKLKKWADVGVRVRERYLSLLLREGVFSGITIHYSEYKNKKDYINLMGSHIAKSILDFRGNNDYQVKIFIDKMDKTTHGHLKSELTSYRLRYKKIVPLNDKSSALIRLADAVCGLIRDLNNRNIDECYKKTFSKVKKI